MAGANPQADPGAAKADAAETAARAALDASIAKAAPASDYLTLIPAEQARGLVRPLRGQMVHETCGTVNVLDPDRADMLAKTPDHWKRFMYCAKEDAWFPIGQPGQFSWVTADGKTTPVKVGS